uniref:Prostacyclin synthase n=1 Tax=Cynoglossus semilaevis TaxID=244447 RepID=A0A3P8UKE7_CYNSE
MFWTIILLLTILVLLCTTRTRQKNEPPLDKGLIPWLGHALEFKKDVAAFLVRMKKKHGDIFTVCLAGNYVTVLLDPHSFDAVINDTTALDYSLLRDKLLRRIFSLQLSELRPVEERKWMEQHFNGLCLSELRTSMNVHLRTLLLGDHQDCGPSGWKNVGLYSLCHSLLFRAGYLTLFERKDNDAAVHQEFLRFDSLLTDVARSRSRESGAAEESSWQQSYHRFLQQQRAGAETQTRASLLQLWTTQCNVGPAAFWLLGYLLTHPEAMDAVRSEVRHFTDQDDYLRQSKTPVFDSTLSETLRLTAAVMIKRAVLQDKTLRMASGQEYQLRQGDIVCLFPLLSPQMDPEIHRDPQIFKYDRFLGKDKDAFYKGNRRLKYYTMPWGAGRNMSMFLTSFLLGVHRFVFLFLTHLDLELCDPLASVPPVNPNRYGFGILQPDGDLQVRYRLKRRPREI